MNIYIVGSNFTDADKDQLAILFKNAATKFEADVEQRFGKAAADAYSVYVTNSSASALQQKTAIPSTSIQNITPDSGYSGLSKVVVDAVNIDTETYIGAEGLDFSSGDVTLDVTLDTGDCEITIEKDTNLTAANIKKDVVIYGVTGTYEG